MLADEKCVLQTGWKAKFVAFWNCQTSANKRLTNLTREKAAKQNLKRVSLQRLKEAAMGRWLKAELKAELQNCRGSFFIVYLLQWGCGFFPAYVLIFVYTQVDQFNNYSKCCHAAFPTCQITPAFLKMCLPHHSACSTIGGFHWKASEDFFWKKVHSWKIKVPAAHLDTVKKPCSPHLNCDYIAKTTNVVISRLA